MPNVVFVAPYALEATTRFVDAVTRVPDARVGLVSSDPLERFPESIQQRLAGHWRIGDCLDPSELAAGVAALGDRLGGVDRMVGILENLLVPLAEAREKLGVAGMSAEVARNFRDKARMKAVLQQAGLPCARNQLAHNADDARGFARGVGLPLVVKPPAGAGARNTFRIEDHAQLEEWLAAAAPSPSDPALLEEFLAGDEHSFDSAVVGGEVVWHSISRYHPTPLQVLETPWIQWCVLLPRRIDGPELDDIRDVAARSLRALGLDNGFSHMEWFRRPDGSVAVSEVGARPPGAQFMSLMSWAHETDLYAAWAAMAVTDGFEPPTRQFAVGAAYLRAQGRGQRIVAVRGVDHLSEATKSMVVEANLPELGGAPAASYEGDGFVIVRHADTEPVEQALGELITTLHVECG
jgi:hypothetical protein